jgi:hypothetical protein
MAGVQQQIYTIPLIAKQSIPDLRGGSATVTSLWQSGTLSGLMIPVSRSSIL